jgi:hypothetical protein
MRTGLLSLLPLLLLASSSLAGELFGTITDGTRPIASGVKVEIAVSGQIDSTETGKFGSYRIVVKEKGKCRFTLYLRGETPSIDVISFDRSTRYDWILETKAGKLSLRRK